MQNNDYKFAILIIEENKISSKDPDFMNRLNKFSHIDSGFNYFINNNGYKNTTPEELENIKYALTFIYHNNENNKPIYSKICWCEFKFQYNTPKNCAVLKSLYESDSEIVIENAASSILLDINNDFDEDTYITVEYSPKIFNQFKIYCKTSPAGNIDKKTYEKKEAEDGLCQLAQRNEYCLREHNLKIPAADERNEYQRDYDRILYSKAFRRLADKTQVFSSSKGDHYRIRMTHTMIVCQIARSISNALKLNTDLTEAIALGHDLGHTPFGHVGERTLNDKLCSIDEKLGGFKHNYQGLRVVTKLENQYTDIDGLDLSYQVLDGIFKHTSRKNGVLIEKFVNDKALIDYIGSSEYSVTLEGQIVAAADEIAQRSHDIDDAITSKLLTLEEFNNYLSLNKFNKLKGIIIEVEKRLDDENMKIPSDRTELESAQISSAIIKFFIDDVINEAKKKIKNYTQAGKELSDTAHIITEKLIGFSENGERICNYLEKVVNNNIIASNEVSTTDQNSKIIIEGLFDAYLNNPKLLHNGTKMRIYADYVKCPDIKDFIPLVGSNHAILEKELEKIKEHNGEYKLKFDILVRNICDFIAGMTDTYALNEYKKIYQNTLFGN